MMHANERQPYLYDNTNIPNISHPVPGFPLQPNFAFYPNSAVNFTNFYRIIHEQAIHAKMLSSQVPTSSQRIGPNMSNEFIFSEKLNNAISSPDSQSRKRGKYNTYEDSKKAEIMAFMASNGIEQTLKRYQKEDSRISRRKLKSWIKSSTKPKSTKGRKVTEPERDLQIAEWCHNYFKTKNKHPTRKETANYAKKISTNPDFKASKGWLDKFSRKHNIEFTQVKNSNGKKKSKNETEDYESVSTNSTSNGLNSGHSPVSLPNHENSPFADSPDSGNLVESYHNIDFSENCEDNSDEINELTNNQSSGNHLDIMLNSNLTWNLNFQELPETN